tara:strand:- start:265 stop:981 length:717 start_codon:yes stop_codon:yes gene_type:complete
MPKTKKKRKIYFGQEVQDAIVDYNTTDKSSEKNTIYETRIHKAFDKLAENIINTFKFSYFDSPFDDIKHEVVAFMVMNMHKYNHEKGSKAFSYFSVVAKNYLILNNNANYKKLKSHGELTLLDSPSYVEQHHNDSTGLANFTKELIVYLEKKILNIFKKKRDIDIAYAILELMKRRDEIENFNKKSLYLLIREITGVQTSKVTKIVNELKKHYKIAHEQYNRYGSIENLASRDKNKFF